MGRKVKQNEAWEQPIENTRPNQNRLGKKVIDGTIDENLG